MSAFIYSGPSIWPSLAKAGLVTIDDHETPTGVAPLGWAVLAVLAFLLWRHFR